MKENSTRPTTPGGSSPEVVFFDAAGTLIEVRGSVGEIYNRVAREFGFEAEPQILQQNFAHSFRRQPPMAFPAGTPDAALTDLEKRWWRNLVKEVFAGLGQFPRFDEFFNEIFERFRGRDLWRVYGDVAPTLTELKRRGLKLGVISNFDSRLYDVLQACELDRYFDSIHISTRVGAAKPAPAIFQAALDYHTVEPNQAWLVGDSLRDDVEGAEAVGIRASLIDREAKLTEFSGILLLTDLRQLPERLFSEKIRS
ncbi:MAG TPA: HAD-IA family hydrolase [Blastocatellia bacterium]|nr:HAD-IA family hydrolase [Blastocatellia bacterium]